MSFFVFVWIVRCTFSFRLLFVYFVTMGWISTPAYVIMQSISQEGSSRMCATVTISLAGNYAVYSVYSVYSV